MNNTVTDIKQGNSEISSDEMGIALVSILSLIRKYSSI